MNWLLLVAGTLGVLYVVFRVVGQRPYVHRTRLSDLHRFVRAVRCRAVHGGHLLVRPIKAETPFVQMRRVSEQGTLAHLEVGFPLVPWSEAAYPVFQAQLAQAGIGYEVLPGSYKGAVRGFVAVNCGEDDAFAVRVLHLAGAAVGWSDSTELGSLRGALIGWLVGRYGN